MSEKTFEEKKTNPAAAYAHPNEVLEDASLSREQKIEVLREWHYDATRLQDSAAENMTGGEEDRLQSVSNALLKLGVSATAEADPKAPKPPSGMLGAIARFGQYLADAARSMRGPKNRDAKPQP